LSAADAEASFKVRATEEFGASSLGKEFFIMDLLKAEALFNKQSPSTGLDLRVASKTAK
jgi:ABC-type lipoprotein release transport system permease subunit